MTSAILAVMSGAALAADLPSRVAPPVYTPPPLPVFTWTGAYFGINAGYAFDHHGDFHTAGLAAGNQAAILSGARPATFKIASDGFTGGGQIGYNYEIPGFGGFGGQGGGIVLGVEADAAYTDLNRNNNYVSGPLVSNFRSGLDFLGTVRGRLGFAFGQFMIYGTGGFAYGSVDNRVNFYNGAGGVTFDGSRDRIETGYTYGGGIEYALPTSSFLNFFRSSAVTVKAEYLHYDLGRSTILINHTPLGAGAFSTRVSNDGDLVRVGLNYKFGSY